jgi:hypothetical protein
MYLAFILASSLIFYNIRENQRPQAQITYTCSSSEEVVSKLRLHMKKHNLLTCTFFLEKSRTRKEITVKTTEEDLVFSENIDKHFYTETPPQVTGLIGALTEVKVIFKKDQK